MTQPTVHPSPSVAAELAYVPSLETAVSLGRRVLADADLACDSGFVRHALRMLLGAVAAEVEPVAACHDAELHAGHPSEAHDVDAADTASAALAPGYPTAVTL